MTDYTSIKWNGSDLSYGDLTEQAQHIFNLVLAISTSVRRRRADAPSMRGLNRRTVLRSQITENQELLIKAITDAEDEDLRIARRMIEWDGDTKQKTILEWLTI